jgi:ring-1,2-phenylacetyl-CoA epoxidase subunit PaaC
VSAAVDEKIAYLLRQGDNALILSQRLSQLCGKGPALEEDMAVTNVALDLLGQTRMWYAYASELEGRGRTEDELAFLRDAHQMHNCLIAELPNGNYADTMVRQFFFDAWHYYLMQGLLSSSDARVAEIAEKSVKEVTYHLRRSGDLVVRMGDGTPESHAKTQAAVNDLWMYSGEMFAYDAIDEAMVGQGVAPAAEGLRAAWPKRRSPCRQRTPGCKRAARRAATASTWATCWPRCSSCSAPIPEPSGNEHRAGQHRAGLDLARRGVGPRDSRDLGGRPGHRARRRL